MKNNQQTFHLLFDISLFTGFIIAFLLDWTGVINHQWLGIAVIAGSLIHLLWHSAWVKNVLQRFAALSDKLLITFFVDIGLAFGFTGILMTGLILSTWLNLPLQMPTRRDIDRRLVVGSALFGIGWGLSGFCPGPGLVSLGAGYLPGCVFAVALIVGVLAFALYSAWLEARRTELAVDA